MITAIHTISALIIGGIFGAVVTACVCAAGAADEASERALKELESTHDNTGN